MLGRLCSGERVESSDWRGSTLDYCGNSSQILVTERVYGRHPESTPCG
jgi:hypothetical protein